MYRSPNESTAAQATQQLQAGTGQGGHAAARALLERLAARLGLVAQGAPGEDGSVLGREDDGLSLRSS